MTLVRIEKNQKKMGSPLIWVKKCLKEESVNRWVKRLGEITLKKGPAMTIGCDNMKSSMTKNKISFSGVVKMKAWNGEVKRVCDETWSNEDKMISFFF